MSLEAGTEFAGYTIVRKIGAGGMGEVYLAQHPRLPRLDVIKVLAEHVSNDPTFRARFTREADLAAQLDHPCIVSVYDRGEVDGRLWISMQYVAGTDAAALVKASPGGLPLDDVAAVSDSIGAALDHAHRHGLLHRDVKPANILISATESDTGGTEERRIRLADFGIARQTDGGTSLTSANLVLGSFPYSSPEQLSAETLDARSDVYSLACSAFELLTGAVPFTARTPMMMIHHHLTTPPPDVSSLRRGLPPAVSEAVRHGLAKNPADRPPSAGAFAAEFRHAVDTTGFFPAPRPGTANWRGARMGASTPVPAQTQTMRVRGTLPPTEAAGLTTAPVPAPPRPRPADSGHVPPASSHGHGFPAAYSELPGQTVPGPALESTMIRASGDLHVIEPPPPETDPARFTTASLACGIAAVPLSVVGGFGLPVGVAGWYLAGRGRASPAARLARTLCVLGMLLSLGLLGFTIVRAIALQF
ncbi:serine/threonine-protein kinase [Gordonia sp. GN26]